MHKERGSTIVETMLAIAVLMFIFFGMYRIFDFTVSNMICEYSSFYAAKSWSLGYRPSTTQRAARVAAMPASGRDISGIRATRSINYMQSNSAERAQDYMQYERGGVFKVNYEYWTQQDVSHNYQSQDSSRKAPFLLIHGTTGTDKVSGTVEVRNKPLWPFSIKGGTPTTNVAGGYTTMINYSTNYLVSDNDYQRLHGDDQ